MTVVPPRLVVVDLVESFVDETVRSEPESRSVAADEVFPEVDPTVLLDVLELLLPDEDVEELFLLVLFPLLVPAELALLATAMSPPPLIGPTYEVFLVLVLSDELPFWLLVSDVLPDSDPVSVVLLFPLVVPLSL